MRLLGLAAIVVAVLLAAWLMQTREQLAKEEGTATPATTEPESTATTIVPADTDGRDLFDSTCSARIAVPSFKWQEWTEERDA